MQFGRVDEGFKTYYDLTVQFPNASGLLKGSDVLLAGAKIGRVSRRGRELPARGRPVPLRIFDYVKIPAGSKFTVGSSGFWAIVSWTCKPPVGKPTAIPAEGRAGLRNARDRAGRSHARRRFPGQRSAGHGAEDNGTFTRLNEQAFRPRTWTT